MKRNPAVEMIRIIASFGVLLCHTNFKVYLVGEYMYLKTFYNCILSDPVAVFWLVTGFYIFSNDNYIKLWKHTVKKLVIPAALLYAFYFYFSDYVLRVCSLSDSVSHPLSDYVAWGQSIITLYSPSRLIDHTWYIFAYLLVILFYPMWKGFADYLDQSERRENIFLVLSFVILFINDCYMNQMLSLSFHGMGVLIPSGIMTLWGHIIYKRRKIFQHWYVAILSVIAFLALNALRAEMILTVYAGQDDYPFNTWQTWMGLLSAICVVAFSFGCIEETRDTKFHRLICFVATFTFGYYLIHPIFVQYLDVVGFYPMLWDKVTGAMPMLPASILFLFLGAMMLVLGVTAVEIVVKLIKFEYKKATSKY